MRLNFLARQLKVLASAAARLSPLVTFISCLSSTEEHQQDPRVEMSSFYRDQTLLDAFTDAGPSTPKASSDDFTFDVLDWAQEPGGKLESSIMCLECALFRNFNLFDV